MATRVDIPKDKCSSLQFPPVCPVCTLENPDSHTLIKTSFTTNQPLHEELGASWSAEVPVCSKCKRQITLGRWISRLLFVAMVGVSLGLYMLILAIFGDRGRIINVIILLFLVGSGVVVHGKLYSAPLLFESFSNRLLFTFRNDLLAEDFARLNGVDVVYDLLNQERPIKSA